MAFFRVAMARPISDSSLTREIQGKHLVAAHADPTAYVRDVHGDAVLAQRLRPRLRMRAVAVNERAVDVE